MYAKIFRQIYESSIADDPRVRFTFMDLLVLADKDGVVDMTHEAIARITNVPIEWVRASITALEAPDKRSRTPDENGCRLVRLDAHRDWGWIIVNYNRFRETSTDEQRREQTRDRVNAYRKRLKESSTPPENESVTHCNDPVTLPYAYASSVTQTPVVGGSKGDSGKKTEPQADLLQLFYPIYKRKLGQAPSYQEISSACEIVRRPDWKSESQEILTWRAKLNSDAKYFPHSLVRLLSNWPEYLDQARTFQPKSKPDVRR